MAVTRAIGTFSAWDYVIFAGMLVISAAIGIYYAIARGGQKTTSEFLTGSRSLSAVPVALSLTATFVSAIGILGIPAEVYRFGAMYSLLGFAFLFTSIITAEVFMPVFYRLGITSTYEYLELRFNRTVRFIGTLIFILLMVVYTGIVIYAPALALNQVTGLNLWGAVVITGAVCMFYCTVGGLRAVVWTDVFQIAIMAAGLAAVIIRTVVVQGGINRIIQDSQEGGRLNFWDFNPNPLQRHTFWSIMIGGTFTWTGIYGVNQSQVQRCIACKSRFKAKLAIYISLVGLWVIVGCSVLCGLCLYSVYRDCDPWTAKLLTAPDQLLPYLVMDILGSYPGLPGLFVACVYSGTLSTVSSTINALAAVTVEDLIKPYFPSLTERKLSWIAKGTSFFYGALCIAMSGVTAHIGSVIQAALSIFGMIGGPLLGLFCLGMLFSFTNPAGAITGLICGFAIALWAGIGGQVYPPLLERRSPLNLTTTGCNLSHFDLHHNWTSTTATPMLTTLMQPEAIERPAIADSWYSLSYLYLSTLGTLAVILVGVIVSLLSGGTKQNIDRKYLHCREDFSFDIFSWCRRDTKAVSRAPASASKGATGSRNINLTIWTCHHIRLLSNRKESLTPPFRTPKIIFQKIQNDYDFDDNAAEEHNNFTPPFLDRHGQNLKMWAYYL